jgi:hypothetical protein
MNSEQKVQSLSKLLEKAKDVRVEDSSDPVFKSWKNLCERTFARVFGMDSKELEQFNSLAFCYDISFWVGGHDYSEDHLQCFRRDFQILTKTINLLIEEIKDTDTEEAPELLPPAIERIFISHSSKDSGIVEELIDIIESMGVNPSQIFCSSFPRYGIELGADFLETIRSEINKDVLVLFVLSDNFYQSPVCLCEMGATWVLSKDHIPIIVPPFSFDKIEGVFPLTQGLPINDELKLNLLRDKIAEMFHITPQSMSSWERKRDRAVIRINKKIKTA